MDSVKQTVNIIKKLLINNFKILEINCKSQLLMKSLNLTELNFEYFGIDSFQRSIELGKLVNNQINSNNVSNIDLLQLDDKESYDISVDIFDFRFIELYERYFEKICRITEKYIIIRTPNFGKKFQIRYFPDLLLEKEFKHLKTYVNIFNKSNFEKYMLDMGFECKWIKDKRLIKLNKDSEDVGGINFKYEFLLAKELKKLIIIN